MVDNSGELWIEVCKIEDNKFETKLLKENWKMKDKHE